MPNVAQRQPRSTKRPIRQGGPFYELRAHSDAAGQLEVAIWQLPSAATPRLTEPERTAGLHGRPLRLIELWLFKRLKALGISFARLRPGDTAVHPMGEDEAVHLALKFRALAPMHSIDRIQRVSQGIDQLSREEANYWLGMALHRKNPRRVLAALRVLLTST